MTFRVFALLAGGLGATLCLPAQVAISTHSGLIQFTVGSVYVGDKAIHKTTTNLPDLKNGQVLHTGSDGNAELLLTPGVFLRLGQRRLNPDGLECSQQHPAHAALRRGDG